MNNQDLIYRITLARELLAMGMSTLAQALAMKNPAKSVVDSLTEQAVGQFYHATQMLIVFMVAAGQTEALRNMIDELATAKDNGHPL